MNQLDADRVAAKWGYGVFELTFEKGEVVKELPAFGFSLVHPDRVTAALKIRGQRFETWIPFGTPETMDQARAIEMAKLATLEKAHEALRANK